MANLLLGALFVATWYGGAQYDGQPLYCVGYYDPAQSHLAVPVESLLDGTYQCGDLMVLRGFQADGSTWWLQARVLDTGRFGSHCVMVGDKCAPIAFDVGGPKPFIGLSAIVNEWHNVSAEARRGR